MSLTFTLNGTTSILENNFFPPIILEGNWEIGLLNFETFHSIPNIKNGRIQVDDEICDIPDGAYELEDITKFANKAFGDGTIKIFANKNTLKTEIFCSKRTKLSKELAILMGYEGNITIQPNIVYVSPKPTKISSVNIIRINCNIAQGSFLNGKQSHSIHEFFPAVAPGYKITEVPFNVIYHSINTSQLSTLKIDILDQENRHIDFRGETITIRVHLRRSKS